MFCCNNNNSNIRIPLLLLMVRKVVVSTENKRSFSRQLISGSRDSDLAEGPPIHSHPYGTSVKVKTLFTIRHSNKI